MDEGTMGLVLGLCVASVAFLAWRIERQGFALQAKLHDATAQLSSITTPDFPDLEELRESLEDLVTDTIGQMRTPQLADHLGAMAQQFFQMKMAKQMAEFQDNPMISAVADMITPDDES